MHHIIARGIEHRQIFDDPDQGADPGNRPAGYAQLLDAYSQAVVSVVESMGPAVVNIAVGSDRHRQTGDQTVRN